MLVWLTAIQPLQTHAFLQIFLLGSTVVLITMSWALSKTRNLIPLWLVVTIFHYLQFVSIHLSFSRWLSSFPGHFWCSALENHHLLSIFFFFTECICYFTICYLIAYCCYFRLLFVLAKGCSKDWGHILSGTGSATHRKAWNDAFLCHTREFQRASKNSWFPSPRMLHWGLPE